MPWVRFDDQFTVHRKVSGLSDPAFRLHSEAIFWCARNLTDGFVLAADLPVLATARRPLKFVPELVSRCNWHEAASVCSSKKCPAHLDHRPESLGDGWLIHDYFEYQPTKAKALEERAKNAARQQKWRDAQKETEPDSEHNGVSNGVTSDVSSPSPSRPVQSSTRLAVDDQLTGSQSVRTGAQAREAIRWILSEYDGLTDEEALSIWLEAKRRAADDIKKAVPYLRRMQTKGDLADIVKAVLDASEQHNPPLAEPVLYAVPDPPEPAEPEPRSGPPPVPREQSAASAHIRFCKAPLHCERCAEIDIKWPDLRRSGT